LIIVDKFDAFDGAVPRVCNVSAERDMEYFLGKDGWVRFGLRSLVPSGGHPAGYLWSSNSRAFEEITGIQTIEVIYQEVGNYRPRVCTHMTIRAAMLLIAGWDLPVSIAKTQLGYCVFIIDQSKIIAVRQEEAKCPICGAMGTKKIDGDWKTCEHMIDRSYQNSLYLHQ